MTNSTKKLVGLVLTLTMLVASLLVISIGSSAAMSDYYVHNFTGADNVFNGTSEFYTFAGSQITNAKHGSYTYDFGSGEVTLYNALKFDSNGKISFTPDVDGTITVAVASSSSGGRIKLNTEVKNLDAANSLNVFTYNVTANTAYTLARDNKELGVYYIAFAPSHTHSYTSVVTPPTCADEGFSTYTCTCGNSYTGDVVAATGEHNYVDNICSVCGAEYGHVHSYTKVVTPPTCTEAGYTTYTCECEDSYVADEVAATGHSHTSEITKTPDCDTAGEKTYTCSCGDTYTEAIAALGHTYVNGVCSACDAERPTHFVFETQSLPAAAEGSFTDGQHVPAGTDNYFTLILSAKSKFDGSNKTFSDGYASSQRLAFGGKTSWSSSDNTVSKQGIKFTTSAAATVKVWWVCAGDGDRYLAIWDSAGATVAQSAASPAVKNELYIDEFKISEAGTYYLAAPVNNNYIFKVEVTETSESGEPETEKLTAVDAEGNEITVDNTYFSYKGASIRYADANKNAASASAVAVRFGYTFNVEVSEWGWNYMLGDGIDAVSKTGTYKTAGGDTNLVFTNIPSEHVGKNIHVQLWFKVTIDGTEYTVYDNWKTRTTESVLNDTIELNSNADAVAYCKSALYAYDATKYAAYAPATEE